MKSWVYILFMLSVVGNKIYSGDGKQVISSQKPKSSQDLLLSDIWPLVTAYSNKMKLRQHVVASEDRVQNEMLDLSFRPDSKRVACANEDGNVRIYDFKEQRVVCTFTGHPCDEVNTVDYGDNTLIASGDDDGVIYVWNPENGKEKSKLKSAKLREIETINCVKFNKDITHIASGGDLNKAYIWDIATSKETSTFEGHKKTIRNLVWLSDTAVATAGLDQKIRLWDSRSGQQENEIHTFGLVETQCFCLRITADTSNLLWQSGSTLHIWDLQANKELKEISINPDYFKSVTLSHDDQTIVTTTDKVSIDFYDRVTGHKFIDQDIESFQKDKKLLFNSKGEAEHYALYKLTYSPNNKYMAGLYNNRMYMWDQVPIYSELDKE